MTMIELLPWLAMPAAFALDSLLGDPRWLPHPIRWMGRAIEVAEPLFRRWFRNELLAGALFALSLILGCWALSFLLVSLAYRVHGLLGFLCETVLLFYCFSAKSLAQAAREIYDSLRAGQVDTARSQVAMIVGRDVERYQADDIARATVETVAENAVDGVISPLFFAALGGVPLALAYKMVNTLDSMVGYKNPRYLLFGRVAARIDDLANMVPARLSVVLIALAAGLVQHTSSRSALSCAWKEGKNHASPNAGYPEAAFAGGLGVQMGGPNYYHGKLVEKPYIGRGLGQVTLEHIPRACRLMRLSSLFACLLAWLGVIALRAFIVLP
nr:adenosylcobinamide-phosphate synthase CbiB [uncultured Desulfobulbus sp.]